MKSEGVVRKKIGRESKKKGRMRERGGRKEDDEKD